MADDIDAAELEFREWYDSLGDVELPIFPMVGYNRDGGQIEVHLENVNYYGKWLSSRLSLYLEQGTDRVVGFKVEGVKELLEEN